MNWKIILLISSLLLIGCKTPNYVILKDGTKIDCNKVPKVWWGEKGEDPSKCELWRCYDWIIYSRE